MNNPQVVIVGGGPVGAALSLDLGMQGISNLVLEGRTSLPNIPKGQGLTQRTLEHFHFWGIENELRAARIMPKDCPLGEITAYKNLISEYWQAPPGREVVNSFYFTEPERLPQYCMESVLRKKISEFSNIDFRLGVKATKVQQFSDGVQVEFKNHQDMLEIVKADYLVGCDGGHSIVREELGISRSGTNYDKLMVLIVFRSRDFHEKLSRFPPRSTYRVMDPDNHGYWKFFGRVDVGESFFFHTPVSKDIDRNNFDFKSVLFQAAGFEFEFEVDHTGFWDLRNAIAQSYQLNRIFIAGDAAHSHPPYGGYGLNNGLEDAINLSWKLAANLKGWGSDKLLETYTLEREPIFREVAENFIAKRIQQDDEFLKRYSPEKNQSEFEEMWNARLSDVGNRRKAYEPNYEGSPVIAGPEGGKTSAYGVHLMQARPGHHLPPQVLSNGMNIYEVLKKSFNLISFGLNTEEFETNALKLGITLNIILDRDGCNAHQNYKASLILIRPDQHIVWVGESTNTSNEILKKAVGLS